MKVTVKILENIKNFIFLKSRSMLEYKMDIFHTSRTNVIDHINNIYEEEELDKIRTCRNFRQVRTEQNRRVSREIPYYNLDIENAYLETIKSINDKAKKLNDKNK